MNTTTTNTGVGDSSFMEHRLNRNGKTKQGERHTSNEIPSTANNYSIFQPSNNSFLKDGLPIVSPHGLKQNQNKSLQQRLTMYNYNPQSNASNG